MVRLDSVCLCECVCSSVFFLVAWCFDLYDCACVSPHLAAGIHSHQFSSSNFVSVCVSASITMSLLCCGVDERIVDCREKRCNRKLIQKLASFGIHVSPRPSPLLMAPPSKALVRLNVYHLIDEATNLKLLKLGFGIFHTGVIVYGIEWSFGESTEGQDTGLFCVAPGNAAGVVYKTLDLGYTDLSPEQVDTLLHRLENEWRSADYHVLNRNCNHFSETFCTLLSTLEDLRFPKWCNRSAKWGNTVIPNRFATWVLRQLDEAPPPAATKAQTSNVGELPTSVVPAGWYKTAMLRRPCRFAIKPPAGSATSVDGLPQPPSGGLPRAGKAAVASTRLEQYTPTHLEGTTLQSSSELFSVAGTCAASPPGKVSERDASEGVAVPVSRGPVKLPDFNKTMPRQQLSTAACTAEQPALSRNNSGLSFEPLAIMHEAAHLHAAPGTANAVNPIVLATSPLELSTPLLHSGRGGLSPAPSALVVSSASFAPAGGGGGASRHQNTLSQSTARDASISSARGMSPSLSVEQVAFHDEDIDVELLEEQPLALDALEQHKIESDDSRPVSQEQQLLRVNAQEPRNGNEDASYTTSINCSSLLTDDGFVAALSGSLRRRKQYTVELLLDQRSAATASATSNSRDECFGQVDNAAPCPPLQLDQTLTATRGAALSKPRSMDDRQLSAWQPGSSLLHRSADAADDDTGTYKQFLVPTEVDVLSAAHDFVTLEEDECAVNGPTVDTLQRSSKHATAAAAAATNRGEGGECPAHDRHLRSGSFTRESEDSVYSTASASSSSPTESSKT